ncbi:MFS transporter [Ramlibacter sp.]|uniref:MFS transporter n=1 Tax=Ramlibacter sp. TaxID=1917967 RepID=UPI002BA77ADB|nr:MFS transporter [Ramlibacter sp.]HWI83052.1 MFS transporter [Ramlibacter sp.]
MSATAAAQRRHSATILVLAGAAFFSGAALRICDSLLPRLAQDFSRTPGTAGRVIISFALAYGLMQLLFGPLGDRYGKARMVCIALFGCIAGSLACALAPNFDALVGMRVAWGMAAAGVIPLSLAWIGDAVPYERRQATLAQLLTGTLGGMMAGQLAGGLFADSALGWRGAFLTLTAGYAVIAVLMLLRLRGEPAPPPPGARIAFASQLRAVWREPWARVVLATVMTEGVFLLGPLAYLPAYLHQRYGLSLSAASALIALYAVGGLAYAIAAPRIVRRLGESRMVLWGGVLMGAGYLAWLLAPVAALAGPIALLVGFGTYLYHNTLQTHATQMAPALRGTSVAMFAFCLFVGQAIGVTLAGATFDHLGSIPLLLGPALALPASGWGFARALRRHRTRADGQP